jgi:hypothetical protein
MRMGSPVDDLDSDHVSSKDLCSGFQEPRILISKINSLWGRRTDQTRVLVLERLEIPSNS